MRYKTSEGRGCGDSPLRAAVGQLEGDYECPSHKTRRENSLFFNENREKMNWTRKGDLK